MNTAETLYRLHGLLPLKERQQRLSREEGICHQAILQSFIEQGRAPQYSEMTSMPGHSDFAKDLSRLHENDLVVLGERDEVVGAYPFTMKETPHQLRVNGHSLYAMCALDALAVSSMFDREVGIDSRCAISDEPISIRQHGLELLETAPSDEILLGIHWQEVEKCAADSLCQEMVFLKNLDVAINWQNVVPEARELFSLQEAMALAAEFFVPLMNER